MLLPWLNGFLSFRKAPITWMLFFLNLLLYLMHFSASESKHEQILKLTQDEEFMQYQGELYSNFVELHRSEFSEFVQDLQYRNTKNCESCNKVLSVMAFRDYQFRNLASSLSESAEFQEHKLWQKDFQSILNLQTDLYEYKFGISTDKIGVFQFVQYQFIHGGLMHLMGNMWFLLILGCFLEPILGAALFLFLYLSSGVLAGLGYLYLSGLSTMPLVGASGSISGLMGFMAYSYFKERVSFLFWLLPKKEYMGKIQLPVYLVILIWFVSDLSGYFSSILDFGSIAYAAHISGFVYAWIIAFALEHKNYILAWLTSSAIDFKK